MSRAFVSDDAPDEPPIIPPRAPLPAGVPNYVTPRGLDLLHDEQDTLEAERQRLVGARLTVQGPDEADRQRRLAVVSGRLRDLVPRIAAAQPVDPKRQAPGVVRFGATVSLRGADGSSRELQIVGVDEANAAEGRVAFTSPVARALTGAKVGEAVEIRTPKGAEAVTVESVAFG